MGAVNVCLVMVVRDEAPIVARAIRSAVGHVSCWSIVDTGSEDRTREIVAAELAGIPGVLHRRPWVDFGHNRTEAARLAVAACPDAGWLLVLDADNTVHGTIGDPPADCCLLPETEAGVTWRRPRLLRTGLPWEWRGRTHEYLQVPERATQAPHDGLAVAHHADGTARPGKWERDLALLRAQVDADPGDGRAVFYLAQTYRDAGHPAAARGLYQRRAAMGDWEEERWYAQLQAALALPAGPERAGELLEAWDARPQRPEPLYALAVDARTAGHHHLAWWAADTGMRSTPCGDWLFVAAWQTDWGLRFERSIAAWWTGRRGQARGDMKILAGMVLPDVYARANLTNLAVTS